MCWGQGWLGGEECKTCRSKVLQHPKGQQVSASLRVNIFSNQFPRFSGKLAACCSQASDLLVSAWRSCSSQF